VYRARFRRIATAAVVVFGVTAWIEAFSETLIDEQELAGSGWDAAVSLIAAIVGTLGLVVYAGLVDKVLEDHREGRPTRPLRATLRSLPLGRLVVADLVLTIATVIGAVLLIIPGFIVFTLLCLVGPIIVSEDRRVFDALRRSARLVRPRFWLVFVLVTIPITLEEDIVHAIDYHDFDHPLFAAFVIAGVIGALVPAVIGLVEVVLTHQLTRRSPDERADTVHA